jgi:stage III sporulation protein AE
VPLPDEGKEEKMDGYIFGQMELIDLEEIEQSFSGLFPGFDIDMEAVLLQILQGNVGTALQEFLEGLWNGISGEVSGVKSVMLTILIIGIVSGLFSNFSDIFGGQQISDTGFYFLYMLLAAVLTKSFVYLSELAETTVENVVLFVKLFLPAWLLTGSAALGTTPVYYYQIMLFAAYLTEAFLLSAVLPFIYSYVVLTLLNGIWAEERLVLLLDVMKKGIELMLKGAIGVITGMSLVQSVISPVIDSLRLSVFRKTVSVIPGIGTAAENVTELVIGSAVLIKNSMGILLLLLLLAACLVPLVKILAVAGVIKMGAALAGIISDKRIAGCADRVGTGCFLLLRCVLTAAAMFVIVIAVIACALR